MDNHVTDLGNVEYHSAFPKDFMHPYGFATIPLSNYKDILSQQNCEFFYKPHLAFEQLAHTIHHNFDAIQDIETIAKESPRLKNRMEGTLLQACAALSTGMFEGEMTMQKSVNDVFKFLTEDDEFLDAYIQRANSMAASLYLMTSWMGVTRLLFRDLDYLEANMHRNSTASNFKEFKSLAVFQQDVRDGLLGNHMALSQIQCHQPPKLPQSPLQNAAECTGSEEISSDESVEDEQPPPKHHSVRRNRRVTATSTEESEEDVQPQPKKQSSRRNHLVNSTSSDESEEDQQPPPTKQSSRRNHVTTSSEESDEDQPPPKRKFPKRTLVTKDMLF